MKKYIICLIIFALSFIFEESSAKRLYQQWHGTSWAFTKKQGKGTLVFAYTESPTFSYKDKTGKLTGVCVDIMQGFVKYVEQKHKVKLTIKYESYPHDDFFAFYNLLKSAQGGVFGLTNATITPERQKEVQFSPPFLNNISIIMTNQSVKSLSAVKNIGKDFVGMTAYTNRGTANERRLLQIKKAYFPQMKIIYLPYNEDVLAQIAKDPKAFTCLDFNYYSDGKQKNRPFKRHPAGDDFSEELGLVMPLKSDWAVVMKEYFAANGGLRQSKPYKQMLTKHLGTEAASILLNK